MVPKFLHSFSYLSSVARRWVPAPSTAIQRRGAQRSVNANRPRTHFGIVSWNVDYSSGYPSQRCLGLINHVFRSGVPDVLCLQEVRPDVRATLLGNFEIRDTFLTTDAEPNLEYKRFTTMTLLSKKSFACSLDANEHVDGSGGEGKFIVGQVFRQELPSRAGRDGLYVDLILPDSQDAFLRIINVHLESCDAFPYRAAQLKQLASALYEPGCTGGVIAGDFNATTDEDHQLIEGNQLKDAWLTLHGGSEPDAPTWSVGRRRDPEFDPKRLDKMAMLGLEAKTMEIMHPLCIDVPNSRETSGQIEWSDHSGLRCTFCF